MENRDAQSYYDKLAERITQPTETRNKAKDFSHYDIQFMRRFENQQARLLDLGAGTGLLVNHLVGLFKKIVAVEKYPQFSKFIVSHRDLEIVTADIAEFQAHEQFEIITAFGVMNFFNKEEARGIYWKSHAFLVDGGVFIVKNQMGVDGDVVVDGWSEELQTNYYSEYRHVDSEIELLKEAGFGMIEKVDIYPEEYNRFKNTHFYALICRNL